MWSKDLDLAAEVGQGLGAEACVPRAASCSTRVCKAVQVQDRAPLGGDGGRLPDRSREPQLQRGRRAYRGVREFEPGRATPYRGLHARSGGGENRGGM